MTGRTKKADAESSATPDLAVEIAELRRELKTVLSSLQDFRANDPDVAGRRAGTKAAEGVGEGEKAAGPTLDALRDEWKEMEDALLTESMEHPLRTIGFAVLGGMVLGLLLRR